jgi:HK97 family phage prohead protease
VTVERRYTRGDVELRAAAGAPKRMAGYAAVFNSLSQNLGGFVERIAPGAFSKTLLEADVKALFNHDANLLLGRSKSGTLRMEQDDVGLRYEVDLPETTLGRDLSVLLERGDVSQSSFAFRVVSDEWGTDDQDRPVRTLVEVKLFDVSPVTYPAYLDTEASMRLALPSLAEARSLPLDDLIKAARANDLARALRPATTDLLTSAPVPATTPSGLLARFAELHARRPR